MFYVPLWNSNLIVNCLKLFLKLLSSIFYIQVIKYYFKLQVNGLLTLRENIADNGGIKQAYKAYNEWKKRKNIVEPRLPGLTYTSQQMFWISTANLWCAKYHPDSYRFLIATDSHSPAEFRINGALSNIPEFSKDFNCPPNSKMNPSKKCVVWWYMKLLIYHHWTVNLHLDVITDELL